VSRLFIAVWPPSDIVARVAGLRREEDGVRFLPAENWHVTLRFFGEAEPDQVTAAMGETSFPAATARLGPAVGVIARSAIAIPVGGLDALAGEVVARTSAIGQPPRDRFRGHLTIARLKTPRTRSSLRGTAFRAEFDIAAVTLVRSHLGRDGARYEVIRFWAVLGCGDVRTDR
jgi:RNA 2',3'-cyclic 3'-phosphodiesterase